MSRPISFLLAGLAFVLLATANAAGYRYGGADQAFYIPAVARILHPDSFPRDASLIDAQAALAVVDDVLATVVRVTGLPTHTLFFVGYLTAIGLTWAGLVAIGTGVSGSVWLPFALGAAFTMRHRIARTSANTFEPYFHPRMLAFAVGMLAIAAVLRRRGWLAVALTILAAVIHTTTALWFALLLGVALAILDPLFRRLSVFGMAIVGVVLAWAALAGPLSGAWTRMDPVWLQAVASKDSLFADQWPAWAWVSNLGLLGILWGAHAIRLRRGMARPTDTAIVWGATALVAVFLVTLPLVIARVSLVVEFQISRVFWLVDLLATLYLLAVIVESPDRGRRLGPRLAVLVMAIAVARGSYIMLVERPERDLFAITVPASPWEEAMAWLATQPVDTHVLADPGHGWKFGTSVRVTAGRDVLLEEVKDSAIAIYSRAVAMRVVERTTAIGDYSAMTAERATALAARYDLDVIVTEADMPLPLAYRNAQFRIYRLASERGPSR